MKNYSRIIFKSGSLLLALLLMSAHTVSASAAGESESANECLQKVRACAPTFTNCEACVEPYKNLGQSYLSVLILDTDIDKSMKESDVVESDSSRLKDLYSYEAFKNNDERGQTGYDVYCRMLDPNFFRSGGDAKTLIKRAHTSYMLSLKKEYDSMSLSTSRMKLSNLINLSPIPVNISKDIEIANKQLTALKAKLDSAGEHVSSVAAHCQALQAMIDPKLLEDKNLSAGTGYTKTSTDQKISCKAFGYITQDYKMCANIINAYDGYIVARSLKQVGSTAYNAIDNQQKQHELSKDPSNPTNALQMQKQLVESAQTDAYINAGMSAAQGATLWSMYSMIPTKGDLLNQCVEKLKGNNRSNICESVLAETPQLLSNEDSKERIKALIAEAGVQAAQDGATALILGSQADIIGKKINEIDAYDAKAASLIPDEIMVAKCLANPTSAGCEDFSSGTRYAMDGGSSFNIGDTGTTLLDPNNPLNSSTTDGSAVAARGISAQGLGGSVGGVSDQGDGSFASNLPAAGQLSDAKAQGGGGGGMQLGNTQGTGAGAKADSQGDGKSTYGNYKDSAYNFEKGRGLASISGRSAMAPKAPTENPFTKLFGGKPTNETLNFRDIASASENGKSTNIFNLISSRYSKVNESKRLLEYETEK